MVGGASLAGGRGHVLTTFFGALTIAVVQNGLNLNAVSTSLQSITIGGIILLAVGVDIWRGRLSAAVFGRFAKAPVAALQGSAQ